MRISFLDAIERTTLQEREKETILKQQQIEKDMFLERNQLMIAQTELEAERKLREVKMIEEEGNQMRSLIGNIAHDLKTPLQSLRMDLELIEAMFARLHSNTHSSDSPFTPSATSPSSYNDQEIDIEVEMERRRAQAIDPDILQEFTRIVRNLNTSCDLMSMAINIGLDFSKASAGIALEPIFSTFELSESVTRVVSCIDSFQANIDFNFHASKELSQKCKPFIRSDKSWFDESLLCYLSNTVKYGNENPVDIYVELIREGDIFKVKISVEDNGIGLSKEEQEVIFTKARQMNRMATGGTGLGLYILAKRMEAMGGRYGVTFRRDGRQGTAFWLSVPYVTVNNVGDEGAETVCYSSETDENQESDIQASIEQELSIDFGSIGLNCRPCLNVLLRDVTDRPQYKEIQRILLQHGHSALVLNDDEFADALISNCETRKFDIMLLGIDDTVDPFTGCNKEVELIRDYRQFEYKQIELSTEKGCQHDEITRLRIVAVSDSRTQGWNSFETDVHSLFDHVVFTPFQYKDLETFLFPQKETHLSSSSELTSFWYRLPSQTASSGAESPQSSGSRSSSSSYSDLKVFREDDNSEKPSLRILLVDDSISILKAVGRSLTRYGHQVEKASNGNIALTMLQSQNLEKTTNASAFDRLITDMQMPVMGGVELIRRYRELELNSVDPSLSKDSENSSGDGLSKKLIMIGMSANTDAMSREAALNAGADFFISKPFQYRDLEPLLFP